MEFVIDGNESTDLAVDALGRLHVLSNVVGVMDAGLRYSVRAADGGWTHSDVVGSSASTAGVGTGCKILLDASGRPHIAYTNQDLPTVPNRARLFYGVLADAGWQLEEVEDAGFQIGIRFGFELDPQGQPHLGYRVRNAGSTDGGPLGQAIRYATRSAAGWSHQTVARLDGVTSNFAVTMALAPPAVPHLFFLGYPSDGGTGLGVRHAGLSGANWLGEDVPSFPIIDNAAAGALPNGDLLLMHNGTVMWKSGSTWQQFFGSASNQSALKVGPAGDAWTLASSSSTVNYQLHIGRFAGGQYRTNDGDGGIAGGRYHGLAFGPGGQLWATSYRQVVPVGVYVYRIQ